MSPRSRTAVVASAAFIAAIAFASPASAAPEDYDIYLPAGLACEDIDLGIDINVVGKPQRDFYDQDGMLIRTIDAGLGNDLVFTDDDTGRTFSLKANGSVSRTTYNPDGTRTVASTGHNVVILFPTDVPAGPSTQLYVGRLAYTADDDNNFVLQSFAGTTTDICAALSG